MSASGATATLADVFVSLADTLREGYDVVDTMDLLVQAGTTFTSATAAGILLADGQGRLHVVASTSERAADVEDAQLGSSEGPCFDCIATGDPVEVPDIGAERQRWPRFAQTAESRGFVAAHAIPLRMRSDTLGGMNLLSDVGGVLSDRDAALAQALAQIATISVVQHLKLANRETLTKQLQLALDSRVLIEQAKGVLSQQRGISVEAAFGILRDHARRNQTGLKSIAQLVVSRTLTLE